MKVPFRYSLLAAALLAFAGTAQADDRGAGVDGYLDDTRHSNVTSAHTRCVRTGYWTPALGTPECEGGARAEAPIEPKRAPQAAIEVQPAPLAAPAPIPAAAPEPAASAGATAPSVISGEVGFDFDRFHLIAQAKAKLDSLVEQLKLFTLEQIVVTGHADRIGADAYIECLQPDRRAGVEASGTRPQVSSR